MRTLTSISRFSFIIVDRCFDIMTIYLQHHSNHAVFTIIYSPQYSSLSNLFFTSFSQPWTVRKKINVRKITFQKLIGVQVRVRPYRTKITTKLTRHTKYNSRCMILRTDTHIHTVKSTIKRMKKRKR